MYYSPLLLLLRMDMEAIMAGIAAGQAGHMGHAAYRDVMPQGSTSTAERIITAIMETALHTGSVRFQAAGKQRAICMTGDIITDTPAEKGTGSARCQDVKKQKGINTVGSIITDIPTTA